jgi:hypothetical protein
MLTDSVNQSLHPRINTEPVTRAEIDDFFERHIDEIAEAIKEPDVVHGKYCTNGKRQWMFNRHWPFIHTWISTAVCVCEINQIMRQHRETQRLMDEIVEALHPRVITIDLSQFKPETQLAIVKRMKD